MKTRLPDICGTIAERLRQIVAPEFVISDPEIQKPYECDALTLFTEMPMLVVLPENTQQVQDVMALCHEFSVPVVARGAGTGLCAGSTPHAEGVLLSLSRMNRILDIDSLARTARVQPGVRNLAVSEAAREFGLYYGPDPSSQIACSIGGNVAENSGGVHCLKYGLTVHNILKLELVTVEGKLITIGSDGLDNSGPDLLALLTGSEGLLGIVTEITVRLLPVPEKARIVLAAFHSIETAAEAVSGIIGAGLIPAGLEMMDGFAIRAVEAYLQVGYPVEAEAMLLCELDGTEAEVESLVGQVESCFRLFGAFDIRVSQNEEQRALFWQGRKSAFPAIGQLSSEYYCMDGTIPKGQLAHVLAQIQKLSEEYGLRVTNVFHAGDGNLHPLILFDAAIPKEKQKAVQLGGDILELCVAVGGCITGEHGVGLEKLHQMKAQFNSQELAQFHRIKKAFDPDTRLNPGKGIPMLKRCQEYRALPVEETVDEGVEEEEVYG